MDTSKPIVSSNKYSADIRLLRSEVLNLASHSDEYDKLSECLEILKPKGMPCSYTDEEFAAELRLSEKEGFVSDEEFVKSCKEKWGVEL